MTQQGRGGTYEGRRAPPQSAPSITAIVPTWNEADWLPTLLESLGADEAVTQVVVADNASTDRTVEIAIEARCDVVRGGLPAYGRNAGARVARGDLLLFVDADVAITPALTAAVLREFEDPSRSLLHFRLQPLDARPFVRFCYLVTDIHASVCKRLGRHQGSAPLICVRREAFLAVGGFDEEVKVAEDIDFIHRVNRTVGGVDYVRDTPVHVSTRRFDLEPGMRYALKCVMWGLLRFLGLRISIVKYRWVPYRSPGAAPERVVVAIQDNSRHQADGPGQPGLPNPSGISQYEAGF